jgi:predicted RNA-binding Zn-ribbon protein involved in translation (DUF1610 family)
MEGASPGCPGQDLRWLQIHQIVCPSCGYEVEFFSDERTRACPACGATVDRLRETNCADWCAAAATCALLRGSREAGEDVE